MSRRNEELRDKILFAHPHADSAFSTPPLVTVSGDCSPLDIAGVRYRNRHVLFSNKILDAEFTRFVHDLTPTVVAELLTHGTEFI